VHNKTTPTLDVLHEFIRDYWVAVVIKFLFTLRRWRSQDRLHASYQVGSGDVKNLGYLQQHNKVRALDSPLDQADKRAIQARRCRKLLLRYPGFLPGFT
jgi:hypothetical protein